MYNIYCDESCHLENDRQKSMVLGAVIIPKELVKQISNDIADIKVKHGLNKFTELKWTKVSNSKLDLFLEIARYFFSNKAINFRALVVPDKSILNHAQHQQTHDDWYYKMYYNMLRPIIDSEAGNYIYLDIKDTQGARKVKKLQSILCTSFRDFDYSIVRRIQLIRSEESQILQLADLLIGAVGYWNRQMYEEPGASRAKIILMSEIIEAAGHTFDQTTPWWYKKFNILVWNSRFSS
ncbi:DUF3800 domain-containing protein [Aneurinibacillus aneurinilyticus]|uniref:DUF3800 domain-containing protein n=1 Tax=Aneurinibacillus aneurinilyticus TaxID=1391 RepID=UPI0023F19C54|nr:DUF3800 domain-containing protein [Aneurinibacillus aneurinilyticus]